MNNNELSELTKQHTSEEWKDLGFFYDYDDANARWRLIGSRDGLLRFCELLDKYVADERNTKLSEHEHYGPYMYLKIVTWAEPNINAYDIRGTIDDLRKLAGLVRYKLENASVDNTFEIDGEYSSKNESKLKFEIKEDGFDPAKADPSLWV